MKNDIVLFFKVEFKAAIKSALDKLRETNWLLLFCKAVFAASIGFCICFCIYVFFIMYNAEKDLKKNGAYTVGELIYVRNFGDMGSVGGFRYIVNKDTIISSYTIRPGDAKIGQKVCIFYSTTDPLYQHVLYDTPID